MFTAYLDAAGFHPMMTEVIRPMVVTGMFGMEALEKNVSVKVPEWWEDQKHTIYTGVRLAQIKDDPDFYQGACNAHDFMQKDPDCGKPGPHPVVFDELAKRLNKSDPEAKWGVKDTTKLCSIAEDLFFNLPASSCLQDSGCQPHECLEADVCTPMAYRRGPSRSKAACEAAWRFLPGVFGDLTTTELKALLTEDKIPAAFADKVNDLPVFDYEDYAP